MARPNKSAPVDISRPHELSVGLIERLACPVGLPKAFVRDADVSGLRVRVTANGAKAFVYEAKIQGKAFSRTLGKYPLMSIEEAKAAARDLARIVKTEKTDPRALEREQEAAKAERDAAAVVAAEGERVKARAAATTVGEVWAEYLAERRMHWGNTHYKDHVKLARAGGVKASRGTNGRGVTIDMPLYPLMALRMCDLDAPTVEAWAAEQAKTRPTSARLAWRLLKVFLNWCAEHPTYSAIVPDRNPAKTKKAREALGKPKVKQDALLREQLPAWFAAVGQIQNLVVSAYLQTLLLTGARPGEVLTMRWDDLNTKWRGLTIRDKVEGERVIPLTPHVAQLLDALPRRNEWVFASVRAVSMDERNVLRRARRGGTSVEPMDDDNVVQASLSGHIVEPRSHLACACAVAGIEGLTLHGLRRSFRSLAEWLEVPVGVVAQIMGHKPSATAEKHYTVRPLDLLRVHHERIEAKILEWAEMPSD